MRNGDQISNSKLALLYDKAVHCYQQERFDEALALFETILAECTIFPAVHVSRGSVLLALDRPAEALECFDEALRLDQNSTSAAYSKGVALQRLGQMNDALENYTRAILLDPNQPAAHSNRALVLRELGLTHESLDGYDSAIALAPHCADIQYGKALSLLLLGQFEEGWAKYEWRKKMSRWQLWGPHLKSPLWTGIQPLEGKTILIQAEQGLGDTIQFCRYVPLVEKLGAKVVLLAQGNLVRLLRGLGPQIRVVAPDNDTPAHDYQVPLLSLPLIFKTDSRDIPCAVPYLRAEPDRMNYWRQRLDDRLVNIGVCWQGDKRSASDTGRSFPIRYLERIAQMSGIRLISLQKNEGLEQLRNLPPGMHVEILEDGFDEGYDAFIDTAAIMECVHLIIASDTAIAHLAGALGRPTWLALRHIPNWRWLLNQMRSPWYPTMHLFRQNSPGDWQTVFAAMENELKKLYCV
jgi:TPR repeat/Tetratricopeptide repeat